MNLLGVTFINSSRKISDQKRAQSVVTFTLLFGVALYNAASDICQYVDKNLLDAFLNIDVIIIVYRCHFIHSYCWGGGEGGRTLR